MPIAAINPSRMDRRITLRFPVQTRGDAGGVSTLWVDAATVWAEWLPRNSREFSAAQSRFAEASGIFRIRHRTDIDETWTAVLGDSVFEILGFPEIGRRDALDLIVTARKGATQSSASVLTLHESSTSYLALHDATATQFLLHTAA